MPPNTQPLTWLRNDRLVNVLQRLQCGELLPYVFRKGYMSLFYDTSRVYVSAPRPGAYTAAELLRRGIVGLYARRRSDA